MTRKSVYGRYVMGRYVMGLSRKRGRCYGARAPDSWTGARQLPEIPVFDVGPAFAIETARLAGRERAYAMLDAATAGVPVLALRAADCAAPVAQRAASNRWRTTRFNGHELMRRFLQHVLPKGRHKVRYYGLWHVSRREHAAQARLLELQRPTDPGAEAPAPETTANAADRPGDHAPCPERRSVRAASCKEGDLTCIGRLYPKQASGP